MTDAIETHRDRKALQRDDARTAPEHGGLVRVRSRMRMPAWFHLLLVTVLATPGIVAIATGSWLAWLAVPVLAFAWLTFSSLRVEVSHAHVHIQFGPFGPRIPVERIERAVVAQYEFANYGGWGIRRGTDGGRAYALPGGGRRGVQIAWRDAIGKIQHVFVSSPTPGAIVDAIERARGGRPVGVRVETESLRGEGIDLPAERAAERGLLHR